MQVEFSFSLRTKVHICEVCRRIAGFSGMGDYMLKYVLAKILMMLWHVVLYSSFPFIT